jgi:cobalt/nickel transport system ATP-binding protein
MTQLVFDNVGFIYPDGHEALRDISFSVSAGEKVALTGDNGVGKSTILLLADALLLPTSGTITVSGINVSRRTAAELHRHVGIVFQNADDQLFMPTVEEDVAFGPVNMRLPAEEVERRVVESLSAVGALELRRRHPYTLSLGQKRSVAIATALAMHPDILLMDEPTSNLDVTSTHRLTTFLQSLPHTCLIATHDTSFAASVCSRKITIQSSESFRRAMGASPQ